MKNRVIFAAFVLLVVSLCAFAQDTTSPPETPPSVESIWNKLGPIDINDPDAIRRRLQSMQTGLVLELAAAVFIDYVHHATDVHELRIQAEHTADELVELRSQIEGLHERLDALENNGDP